MIARMNEAETRAEHIDPALAADTVARPRFPGYVAKTVLGPGKA